MPLCCFYQYIGFEIGLPYSTSLQAKHQQTIIIHIFTLHSVSELPRPEGRGLLEVLDKRH